MTFEETPSRFLRWTLMANALFSAASGFFILISRNIISMFMGTEIPEDFTWVGWSLLLYAMALLFVSLKRPVPDFLALATILLNLAWVIASIEPIITGILSRSGMWIVGVFAEIVLLFGLLHFIGLQCYKKSVFSNHRISAGATSR